MVSSGDAAEQVMRLYLEGMEITLKLSGSAAKNIAAALYVIAKDSGKNQTKGKQALTKMLKSGKELKVFTISEEHLKQFAVEAKRYGVVYCALRGKEKSADGMVDLMVRAEDASKINRIVERFKLATVDVASIKYDIQKGREENAPSPPQQSQPDLTEEAMLLDEMMGAPIQKEQTEPQNPGAAKMEKSPPSEPTLNPPSKADEGTADPLGRHSIREELREIQAQRKQEEKAVPVPEQKQPQKPKELPHQHKQPPKKKKHRKER